MGDAVVKALA